MKLFDWIFGKKEGTPCLVMGKEGSKCKIVDGLILTNVDDALEIRYKWIDETGHTFIADQDDYVYKIDGKMLFLHDVGEVFSANCTYDNELGSEYLNKICENKIGVQMLDALEDMNTGKFPWKWLLIIVGIAALVIFLWKSGILNSLINTIQGSI